jgi:HAE1 family hydrophobic/amphiphilic exporter-1
MTSFAFILGVWPLVHAEGAGAASRQALGTAVFGGMITSTVLAVFFTPVFFVTFQWLAELRKKPPVGDTIAGAAPIDGTPQPVVAAEDHGGTYGNHGTVRTSNRG